MPRSPTIILCGDVDRPLLISLLISRCQRCGTGTDDSEIVTEPVERDGRIVGHRLIGMRCIGCGTKQLIFPEEEQ